MLEAPPDVSAPVAASLRLAASLLREHDRHDAHDDLPSHLVLDVELGGYRWTVTRCSGEPQERLLRLSPREREIAGMVAAGMTNRGIASVLDISPWTVGTHLRRMFAKLEVNCRAAMVALVVEGGVAGELGAERLVTRTRYPV